MMETRSAEMAAPAPATFNPGFHVQPQEQFAPPFAVIPFSGAQKNATTGMWLMETAAPPLALRKVDTIAREIPQYARPFAGTQ